MKARAHANIHFVFALPCFYLPHMLIHRMELGFHLYLDCRLLLCHCSRNKAGQVVLRSEDGIFYAFPWLNITFCHHQIEISKYKRLDIPKAKQQQKRKHDENPQNYKQKHTQKKETHHPRDTTQYVYQQVSGTKKRRVGSHMY